MLCGHVDNLYACGYVATQKNYPRHSHCEPGKSDYHCLQPPPEIKHPQYSSCLKQSWGYVFANTLCCAYVNIF